MEARKIYHVLKSIVDPIHAHSDQMAAIAKWVEAEFEYKPQKQANGGEQSSNNCNIPLVSVSDSYIGAMFPYEDIVAARPTRPENRIRAYNSRQADRREGTKRFSKNNIISLLEDRKSHFKPKDYYKNERQRLTQAINTIKKLVPDF